MKQVYTIGYEGTDIDRFVETILLYGIEWIADLRAVPLSRKPGFSKKSFSRILLENSVNYTHFGSLGDPKAGREAARAGNMFEFQRIYSSHFATSAAQTSFFELTQLVRERTVCLLCFEKEPVDCHRSIVAKSMENAGFQTVHLFARETLIERRKSQRRARPNSGQGVAAAE